MRGLAFLKAIRLAAQHYQRVVRGGLGFPLLLHYRPGAVCDLPPPPLLASLHNSLP